MRIYRRCTDGRFNVHVLKRDMSLSLSRKEPTMGHNIALSPVSYERLSAAGTVVCGVLPCLGKSVSSCSLLGSTALKKMQLNIYLDKRCLSTFSRFRFSIFKHCQYISATGSIATARHFHDS